MKWVKRGLWAAAWSFWLWLGFGLHRELPRDLGPVVCTLRLSPTEIVVGFIGGSETILTNDYQRSRPLPSRRNARTGSIEQRFDRAADIGGGREWTLALRQGVLLAHSPPKMIFGDRWQSLDLKDGQWRDLPADTTAMAVDGGVPWAVAWRLGASRVRRPHDVVNSGNVALIDLRTDRHVFVWRSEPRGAQAVAVAGQPFFAGKERLCIPVQVYEPATEPTHALEVWSISTATLLGRHMGLEMGFSAIGSTAGYAAWHSKPNGKALEVIDLASGRRMTSLTLVAVVPGIGFSPSVGGLGGGGFSFAASMAFSPSGRVLYAPYHGGLLEVSSGQWLWHPRPQELPGESSGREFKVHEAWAVAAGSKTWAFRADAIRDIESGALIERRRPAPEGPTITNPAGTLTVVDGKVHELPYRVNYPLLALCQTILALPLILLWSILRWRRNRRLRMAGGQS